MARKTVMTRCQTLAKCQHGRVIALILTLSVATRVRAEDEVWAVQLGREHVGDAPRVAEDLGMTIVGRVFDNVFLLRGENLRGKRGKEEARLRHPKLEWSERQMGRRRSPRHEEDAGGGRGGVGEGRGRGGQAGAKDRARDRRNVDLKPAKSPFDLLKTQDPLRWRQWYLGAGEGMFLNVTGLWAQGVRGGGVSVAILDDGVELTHLDLALNYDPAASWDLLDADPDPTPVPWSRHGTQLAGIVAATHNNGLCGMGMAPWTGVGAVRMLGYVVWDAVEAAALSYERDHVDVYLAAWGPVDTGAVMEGPGGLADRAMRESIVLGRKGRGSIYIWASGNGGFVGDDCNADGYANSVYTLTVSGSTRDGRPPDYAETCAATFVSTYSGDADPEYQPEERVNGIVTTDTGGECTESFRGSSVSAAMVAGACALALDANPELGWRDMQHLMVQAATPHNPLPDHWKTNGVGRMYSHYFGFGSLDAGRMVDLGRSWRPVPPAFRCLAHAPHFNITLVPDQVFVLPLTISNCQIVETEHVQVNISISSDNRGQLEIDLESPSGTTSKLLPKRPLDVSPYGINRHPFLSVHAWGENPLGTWKVRVVYHKSNILEEFGKKLFVDVPNMMLNWSLVVHGTEVPFSEATPHHYHFNRTQLAEALREQRTHRRSRGGRRTRAKPGTGDDSFRIHTDHWTSTVAKGGKPHSYLLCKVMSSSPALVTSITWHDANGGAPRDVIKRLTGRGALGDKYPALLIVRETPNFEGNFTCRVTFDRRAFARSVDIRSNLSSVPLLMETTQVALEGADVRLPCQGLLPFVRGTWVRNGTRIKTSGRFTVAEDHLAIAAVEEQDAGVYECHAPAPVLRYAHTARVTLLLANGTATLITHYAITTQPQPSVLPTPPLCTRPLEDSLEEEEEDPGPPDCPQPYALVGNHCVMVAEGDGKTWHRARVQCHRQLGDLVKVHDAAFMLALIQFLRVKGLTGTSFWAGGLRTGAKKWSWVDGTSVDLEEPHWYLTPIGLPEDIPLTRKEGEATGKKDTPGRKGFRPSILNLGERLTPVPAGSAKGTRPKIHAGSPTRRRRRRPKKDSQRRRARGLAGPDDVTVIDDVVVDDETTVVDDVEYDAMPLVDEDLEEDVVLTDDDVGADDDFAWTDDVDLYDDVTLPDRPINTWDPPPAEAPPTDALERDLRGASGSGLLLFGPGRQRASSDLLMALSHQRAACMWADLGHFLASCSVLHNLVAICEYTPEEI